MRAHLKSTNRIDLMALRTCKRIASHKRNVRCISNYGYNVHNDMVRDSGKVEVSEFDDHGFVINNVVRLQLTPRCIK